MSEEKKVEMIEVFNKGKARIKYGTEKTDVIIPNEKKAIEKSIAQKIIKMYPRDLTCMGDIAFVDISKDALASEKQLHATTKKELEQSAKNLEAVTKELLEVKAENNRLKKASEDAETVNKKKK